MGELAGMKVDWDCQPVCRHNFDLVHEALKADWECTPVCSPNFDIVHDTLKVDQSLINELSRQATEAMWEDSSASDSDNAMDDERVHRRPQPKESWTQLPVCTGDAKDAMEKIAVEIKIPVDEMQSMLAAVKEHDI